MLTSQLGTDEALADRPGVAEAGNGHVRVLHLDDDDSFLELSKRVLESKHDVEVVHETDPEAALGRLPEVDCVVSDYDMPPMNGIEFLETVREEYPDLPFILFTGKGSEEVAGEAISAGVTDYLQKGPDTERFTVLANRITNAVERYRAHKRAEATSERLRRIYERIDDGFVALDEEWQFTYVNQQGAELLDRPPAELLDTTIWDAFPGTIGSRFEEEYRHALEHQETVTFEEYYEPMETWFEVRAFPSESGLSVYFRDVTERKERQLRQEAVFDNTYQFTGLVEPDGTLVEVNETALEFVGADREEVVGEPLWETPWFQTGTEARRAAREAVETARDGEFYRDELPVQGDDRIAVIDFSVKPVFDDRGEVTLLIPEGRDITELKERERQLERKNDQLEEFASIVSHDLKNPLMVASGNVELAVETGQERYLEDAEAALDRMEEMIDDLLELAKQGTAVENPEPVPMSSVYATVEDDTGVDVEVDAPPELAVVADQKRLYSLVCNLVSNAVEHGSTSPPSETLEDAGSEGASEPSVADAPDDAAEHGDDVTVEVGIDGDSLYVADDGVGIPPGDRETVFEPGTSGEDDGTGFGLAIVEAIADAHEWDVSVTESRWGGARFEVSGLDVRSVE
ncbi:hybrid sensor histidine kinase/response regulator [Natronomonas marina]|uniref:hybrid sensor histidine kinase/response regulator n=1 Tax=Natronomonas marina TaxID=2961939 RepID=UPI0020C99037|nr:PAS domain-containing protein [Natronomonas marina]